jgi:enediyne biosynthesis protein E4
MKFSYLALFFLIVFAACQPRTQFKLLAPSESGIKFGNALTIADTMNILDNELVYNGAGVAVGDWNGDSLPDLFFTANMVDNVLYINRGKLKFEDVTKAAGVSKPRPCWSAGATVVDINTDGRLDLYVSNMMHGQAELRQNLLYVNQGNDANGVPKFREMAAEYGLADTSYSAQTVFFDYDRDGDLDAYILVNQMDMQFANQYFSKAFRQNSPTADKLLRNDFDPKRGHAVFTDVSKQAGIQAQGYGHGVSVADFNSDGWPDLYITNDYLSNDNLFINNGNKALPKGEGLGGVTFSDRAHDCLKHQSWSAMGNDVADINNDGLLDILATDMLPDYNERKKALMRANNYASYQFTEQYSYEYQHIRNTLQLNRGLDPQTGLPRFSDVSQMAGVQETDWSWCPLWFDADNDGFRDLLITNGFPKDITDQDFLAYRNDEASLGTSKADLYKLIPEVKVPNYIFRNNGGDSLTFSNKTTDWGFSQPSFSNGAVYADLDNDGDLDVVMNNINDYAYLYENTLNNHETHPNYLRIRLAGTPQNPMGIGAKVTVFAAGQTFFAEQNIVRGYLSTSEPVLHFGLGTIQGVDSVRVIWPMGQQQTLKRLAINQSLTVSVNQALASAGLLADGAPLMTPALNLSFTAPEADYIDFNVQKTLPHKFSEFGPAMAVGDVNGDGLDDFFVGGSSRVEGTFFIQQSGKPGQFRQEQQGLKTSPEKKEEDTSALLFDADGDGDLDLYCVRGSYQHDADSPYLQDALFMNDGRGHFRRDSLALPVEHTNGRVVRACDFDKDGDLDLFVGGNVVPKRYPQAERSFILRNDSQLGKALKFSDVTAKIAPELLKKPGIINDALWTDFDRDGWPDLLLAGEWMPLTFLKNDKGYLKNLETLKLDNSATQKTGWWTSLCAADFDNDGDTDYVAGNYGLNTGFHASAAEPMMVCANDFDKNGSYDAILAQYDNNGEGKRKLYPFHSRDDMIKQSLIFRRRFLKYADFGKASWDAVLTSDEIKPAITQKVNYLSSSYIENSGNGNFAIRPLPALAQIAPLFGMLPYDINHDGKLDLLLTGNDYGMELYQGRADAFYGLALLNRGKGKFEPMPMARSGFVVPGNGRGLATIRLADKSIVVLAVQNRGPLIGFSIRR